MLLFVCRNITHAQFNVQETQMYWNKCRGTVSHCKWMCVCVCVMLSHHVSRGNTINTNPCSYLTASWRRRCPQAHCKDTGQNYDSSLECRSSGGSFMEKQFRYHPYVNHLQAAFSSGFWLRYWLGNCGESQYQVCEWTSNPIVNSFSDIVCDTLIQSMHVDLFQALQFKTIIMKKVIVSKMCF